MREKDPLRSGICGDRDSGVEYQRHRGACRKRHSKGVTFRSSFSTSPCGRRHDLSLRGATRGAWASWYQELRFDAAAVAVTELGLAFTTGRPGHRSIWGREIGHLVTWDARLTSALVCWLLYAGYLMFAPGQLGTERSAPLLPAVFSIFAFIGLSIVVFRSSGAHTAPAPFLAGGSFPPDWTKHLLWNMVAMMLLVS